MKSLDHSKIYYKGLGQTNEEECTKCLGKLVLFFVISGVMLFFAVVLLTIGVTEFTRMDCIVIGFAIGTFFWLMTDSYPTIQKFRLRLKEIEEGDE